MIAVNEAQVLPHGGFGRSLILAADSFINRGVLLYRLVQGSGRFGLQAAVIFYDRVLKVAPGRGSGIAQKVVVGSVSQLEVELQVQILQMRISSQSPTGRLNDPSQRRCLFRRGPQRGVTGDFALQHEAEFDNILQTG